MIKRGMALGVFILYFSVTVAVAVAVRVTLLEKIFLAWWERPNPLGGCRIGIIIDGRYSFILPQLYFDLFLVGFENDSSMH